MTIIKNKRVLVTGGAGFIGSNIIDKIINQNNIVICLDNFSTGKKENIKKHIDNPNFKLIEGDIRDFDVCKFATQEVDIILHQAALGSVPRSINDPITSNEVNVSGFLNVVIAARDNGVKRIVYAASSSTYGDSKDLPKVEDIIGKPLSPYAITKYVNELYAEVFAKLYDIELIGLRYFNVFGPKQDPFGAYAAVIPLFVKALKNGERPKINGDGSFSRDFTYVANVVQVNEKAATTLDKEAINTIYNVACGEQTSLNELIISIKRAMKNEGKNVDNILPIHGPERAGDVPHSLASINKAMKLLNYKPTHMFNEGLDETIKWYLKNI